LLAALPSLLSCMGAIACPSAVPPGLRGESVGEETVVNGLPMTIKQVTGKESPEDLLARVEKLWSDDRYDVRRQRVGMWDMVSARSAKCNTTLQLIDRGGSFGYFAVSHPTRSTAWLPKQVGVPLPSGVTLSSTVSTVDGGRSGHTIAFSTKRSVGDINDYFLTELDRTGWQAVTSHEMQMGQDNNARVVSGQKEREQISVVLWDDGLTRAVLSLSESP
jgi:hypothetical protein